MTESGSGEGGSANTPPFPPLPTHERIPSPASARDPSTSPPEADRAPSMPAGRRPADDWEPDPRADPDLDEDDEAPLPPPARGRRRPSALAAVDLRRYAERTVTRGCVRIADRLDYAADRIALIARNRPGGNLASPADPLSPIGWMQGTARYLRESDLPVMQADLETRVREKPLQTLLLTLSAGWLLGRILR